MKSEDAEAINRCKPSFANCVNNIVLPLGAFGYIAKYNMSLSKKKLIDS